MADAQPTHSTPAPDTKPRKSWRFWKARKQSVTAPVTHPSPPWWVHLLTDGGRPIVAAVVLLMCAPGEHHLGVLAGWSDRLAWGMAAVLAAYAGIAAAVASKRPAGAPGRASAITGAWLALAVGMSAQPVSHMFVTGHWSADPRPPVWLVIAVSCVPPLVLGHLLHLAATPVAPRATGSLTPADTPVVERVDAPATAAMPPVPEYAPSLPASPPKVSELTPAGTPVTHPAPERPRYDDPRHEAIRALYETGHRPGTTAMRDTVEKATGTRPSASGVRTMRQIIEGVERDLAVLPPAPAQLQRRSA